MARKPMISKELMPYLGLATQWFVSIGLALWLGIFLDQQIGENSKWLSILLPLVVIIALLYRLIKKFSQPKK